MGKIYIKEVASGNQLQLSHPSKPFKYIFVSKWGYTTIFLYFNHDNVPIMQPLQKTSDTNRFVSDLIEMGWTFELFDTAEIPKP